MNGCTGMLVVILIFATVSSCAGETFVWPLERTGGLQWTSSAFGDRADPRGGNGSGFHSGLDLAARKGTRVLAVTDMEIVSCYPAPARGTKWKGDKVYGGLVVARSLHSGLLFLYGHLSRVLVTEGEAVAQGQAIGLVGSTGVSTGPHLHFEVLVDPMSLFRSRAPDEWIWRK